MVSLKPTIGVVALQGAVDLHCPHIEAAGAAFQAVKTEQEFNTVDALILPGGESTTMLKLIERFDLWDALQTQFKTKPVWGICAGTILLAQSVYNPAQKSFGTLPITVERNGYGRQLQSHEYDIQGFSVSFIRAPIITEIANNVDVIATEDNKPVWIQKDHIMATTFHPELNLKTPSPMHQHFVDLVKQKHENR